MGVSNLYTNQCFEWFHDFAEVFIEISLFMIFMILKEFQRFC